MNWRWTTVEKWLEDPKLGAEVGVKEGRFISHMLNSFPNLTMYAIDPWEQQEQGNETYLEWDFKNIYNHYRKLTQACSDRVIEIREYSETAADKVEDGSLDFVFIDAQHDYESVGRDIALWQPKVKKGGLLSGHDYDSKFPGVIKAVNESLTDVFIGDNSVWGKWI